MNALPAFADAQMTVQQMLGAQGVYSPLELLLRSNLLKYDDYHAWRRGECATLDDALDADRGQARSLFQRLDAWARSLRLDADDAALYGVDDKAGERLVASQDRELDALLHVEFRPAADRAQLDIFLDNDTLWALNDLIDALCMRDATRAKERWRRLEGFDPGHWALADAEALLDALTTPAPTNHAEAERRVAQMARRWVPAACAVLRSRARDFLTPLWRDLGTVLEQAPFNPARPEAHASFAYLCGLAWQHVERSVLGVPDYAQQPELVRRLAQAMSRQYKRGEALRLWFSLCWQAPVHFEQALGEPDFPEPALQHAWSSATDTDIEPPIDIPWLPAWAVLTERGLARAVGPCGGETAPERAFDVLRALRLGGTDREDMDNRRALQAIHPGLLQRYLEMLDG